jgi:hypothetical protein
VQVVSEVMTAWGKAIPVQPVYLDKTPALAYHYRQLPPS